MKRGEFEKRYIRPWTLALLILLAGRPLPAQGTVPGEERSRGDYLTLKIAVMGPGDELYFWWGHIALVIDDELTGQSRFYDYGIFSFDNDHFFTNFAFGRLLYSCGVSPARPNINAYIATNRDVTVYTLDLPPEKREEVWRFAENNVLPENRNYYYHHFKDNCSTRIRDIIDLAVDGQFREAYGEASGRFTLRQHVRRHTWFSPVMDWILNFWMGQDIDTPITVWEEMFLPAEVGNRINEFWYTGAAGTSRKLVTGVELINRAAGRPPVLETPRRQWPMELAAGIAVAVLLGLFFFLQEKKTLPGQIIVGISHSLLGLLFGAAGLVLFFMANFTNHDYTFHNSNILFANPLLLAAVPLGILYAKSNNEPERIMPELLLKALWLLSLLGIFLSMLIKLFPEFYQQNLVDQMLLLPIVLVLTLEPWGIRRILERVFWRWFN
ncbi:MAG: DUF4105 domain-containing protein [Treponema sp.]|jgi:hypothetical protein|nr:DUF4105 domain-containing protein [Treponema sp.]